jgi:hypothetical protein
MFGQHVSIEILGPLQLSVVQLSFLDQVDHFVIDSLLHIAQLATDAFNLVNQYFAVVKYFLV